MSIIALYRVTALDVFIDQKHVVASRLAEELFDIKDGCL